MPLFDRSGRSHRKQDSEARETASLEEEGFGPFHPSWMLLGFFILLIGVGTVLLLLPGARAGGGRAPFLDALFTATSAATGTGLIVQDTATYWSFTGQKVILGLLQVGGLGVLIGSTMLLLLIARKVSTEERFLLKEFTGVGSPRGMVLLILGVALYAFLAQLAGSYLLASRLAATMPQDQAWWLGIFHASSAFNNAGFETMGLGNYLPDTWVQLTLAGLSLLGALSFIIIIDLIRGLFLRPLALDTKLVFVTTALLLAGGMVAILATEANNPQTLGPLPFPQKILSAFFHSTTARTTGLTTANVGAFANPTLLVIIALMFIGGSSGSTAGGIKVNTFALLGAAVWSFVRGRRQVTALGTDVHEEQVLRALAIAFLSVVLVFGITLALSFTEKATLLAQLFETVSAFSTTGFSMGLTPSLSQTGKLLITFAMFVGRVGPVTIAFALSLRGRPSRYVYAEEAINVG
ncbi:MAG: potassium transporter TrkG [Chloroflexota bacterium]